MNRTDLLNEINAGRTRLESALVRFTPAQMTELDLPGGWSIKDLIAHLGWWEQRVQEIYHDLAAGKNPEKPVTNEDVDAVNARIHDRYRAWDLDQVREFELAAYRDLLDMVETMPEDDLFDPQRFAWTNGQPFSEWILGNSAGHYEEHMPNLEAKLAEDEAALRPPTPPKGVVERGPVNTGSPNPVVQRARDFLDAQGRDIDKALFDFRFGALPAETVLEVLGRYQNPDGGFFGLEFDISAPQSNPFATEIALNMLCWIDAPRDHPLVQRVVNYLEATQDADGDWRFTPDIYRYEMAPWFKGWEWPNLNPACTTAGFLKQLGLGSNLLHARVQALFDRLANPEDLTSNDFYRARPYALYLQTEWDFPQVDFYRSGVVWWMARQHFANKDMDATHFMEYAPRPESAIAKRLPEEILQVKLNQLLADQSEDGSWPTPYSPHWRKWNTVQNMLVLRAYGKV